uniref:Uncharacterized protein n=1 Tax=Romanomermis culicivorax TaxID=13658 RepID=A0A915HKZ8_ROMCU
MDLVQSAIPQDRKKKLKSWNLTKSEVQLDPIKPQLGWVHDKHTRNQPQLAWAHDKHTLSTCFGTLQPRKDVTL